MTYQRIPGTLEDAIDQIKGLLGADMAAETAGVSSSLIQKWSNPHHDARPNWNQIVLLDQACLKDCGKAPIHAALGRSIGFSEQSQPSQQKDLQDHTLGLTVELGLLAESVRKATDANSPAGEQLSKREAVELLRCLEEFTKKGTSMRDLISQQLLQFTPLNSGGSSTVLHS
jgi:hypothetical protein